MKVGGGNAARRPDSRRDRRAGLMDGPKYSRPKDLGGSPIMISFAIPQGLLGFVRLVTTTVAAAGWVGSPMSWSPDARWLSYTVAPQPGSAERVGLAIRRVAPALGEPRGDA